MIVVRVFLLIMSHTEFRLVYIQRKISHRINSFFIITIAFLSIWNKLKYISLSFDAFSLKLLHDVFEMLPKCIARLLLWSEFDASSRFSNVFKNNSTFFFAFLCPAVMCFFLHFYICHWHEQYLHAWLNACTMYMHTLYIATCIE